MTNNKLRQISTLRIKRSFPPLEKENKASIIQKIE